MHDLFASPHRWKDVVLGMFRYAVYPRTDTEPILKPPRRMIDCLLGTSAIFPRDANHILESVTAQPQFLPAQ